MEKQIEIGIDKIASNVRLHEAKVILAVSLHGIQLKDNIYNYKYR